MIAGSFLPLVKVPLIASWAYYALDARLAAFCWIISAFGLLGIFLNKTLMVRLAGILLLVLFLFTIMAVKWKSLDFFSFLPFASWQNYAANSVKLQWGWLIEFAGAFLLLWSGRSENNRSE